MWTSQREEKRRVSKGRNWWVDKTQVIWWLMGKSTVKCRFTICMQKKAIGVMDEISTTNQEANWTPKIIICAAC